MLVQGVLLGVVIGAVLAVVGAGGAILAVPGLIAVMGLSVTAATTSSLVIVGASAFAGVLPRVKKAQVDVRLGVVFSLLGVVGTFVGTRLVAQVPESVTIGVFAALMLVAAIFMWRGQVGERETFEKPKWWLVVLVASAVGLITGFLGIGGGFLIVPALVLILRVPTKVAVGTSLVAITVNTIAALVFRYEFWGLIPVGPIAAFALAGVAASLVLSPLATRLPARTIQRVFAGVVVAVAIYMVSALV